MGHQPLSNLACPGREQLLIVGMPKLTLNLVLAPNPRSASTLQDVGLLHARNNLFALHILPRSLPNLCAKSVCPHHVVDVSQEPEAFTKLDNRPGNYYSLFNALVDFQPQACHG